MWIMNIEHISVLSQLAVRINYDCAIIPKKNMRDHLNVL